LDRLSPPPLEPIPVTDIKAAAGTWEGIMVRSPANRSDDWVTLRIQEDGTYRFELFAPSASSAGADGSPWKMGH